MVLISAERPKSCYPIPSLSEEVLSTNPVLVVHGGAWAMPDDTVEAHLRGVRTAMAAGWHVLECGGSALDAVEETPSARQSA